MKKLLLSALVVMLVVSANAQVRFGVKAGLNSANQSYSVDGMGALSVSADPIIGFHLGVIADMATSEKFSFQPGLLFSQKGSKISDVKTTVNYIDIPLNLMLKFGSSDNFKVLGFAGPSISYALGGKVGDESITFGSEAGQMKRLDFGLGFGAGVQFSSFQATLGYNMGFANLSNEDGYKVKNKVLSISIAYLFGGK